MPLDNLEPTDGFDIVETKLDAAITKVNEITNNLGGGSIGQVLKKTTNSDFDYSWQDHLPAITPNTRRVLIEKSDGTGVAWYSSIYYHKDIPIDASSAIITSNNTYATLRNSGSSVYLSQTLPNDSVIRKFFIISNIIIDNNSVDGTNAFVKLALKDITNGITIKEENIYTYPRESIVIQYAGSFTCSGQEIGIQYKNEPGQNSSDFYGGSLSLIEIL